MTQLQRKLIPVLFLLSGATGLVYETLWIRILSLGVGSTSQSMSVVLSIFFLGLAIGSFLSGRLASKITRPLLAYSAVELSLSVLALVLAFPLLGLHQVIGSLPLTGQLHWLGIILKFVFVGGLLFVPTVLMGATLPLLVRVYSNGGGSGGKVIARLYALNTAGAVIGAFGSGYWLIPAFGIVGSNFLAVGVNLLVGSIAAVLGRNLRVSVSAKQESLKSGYFSSKTNWLFFTTFMCGFVSIGFEVVWNKYLNIFFGTNLYGIGLVLAIFLFGIAAGSYFLSLVIDRLGDRVRSLAFLLALTTGTLIVATWVLNEAPRLTILLQYVTGGFLSMVAVKTFVVLSILLIPTCLFGALFPLTVSALENEGSDDARTVGLSYSINTIGAILGSYCAGILLIPNLGSSWTVKTLLLALLVTAFVALQKTAMSVRQASVRRISLFVMAIAVFAFAKTDFSNIIRSAYQQRTGRVTAQGSKTEWLASHLKALNASHEEFKALYEGETAIITLSHDQGDGPQYKQYLRLKTSGLNESVYNLENLDELPKYEALVGFLPYLFSRAPKEAFVVGYGGGYTVDFLTSTDLRKVNVVELEKSILKAADFVYRGENPILRRPNLNLQIEDARFVLSTHQLPKQDIIVSQPSHSWLPGASNLFTREFFEIVKGNLTDQGIFSQWLNLYNMDVNVLRSILKTFFEVFPEGAVFTQLDDQELVLLGSKQPIELNLQKVEVIQKNPIFKRKLVQVFGKSNFDLLSLYSVGREEALRLTQDARTNTDANAYAEVAQSRIFYEGLKGAQTPQQYLSSIFNGDYSRLLNGKDSSQFYHNLLVSMSEGTQYDKFYAILKRYEAKAQSDRAAFRSLGYHSLKAQRYPSAYRYLIGALEAKPNVEVLNLLVSALIEMDRYPEVVPLLRKYPKLRDRITECYEVMALTAMGQSRSAKYIVEKMARDIQGYTASCGYYVNKVLGAYYLSERQVQVAIPFLEAYYKLWNNDVENLERMVRAYRIAGDPANERLFRNYIPQVITAEGKRLQSLIDYYERSGQNEDAKALMSKAARLSRPIDTLAE